MTKTNKKPVLPKTKANKNPCMTPLTPKTKQKQKQKTSSSHKEDVFFTEESIHDNLYDNPNNILLYH